MAILNLLGAQEIGYDVDVITITAVNGNTKVDNVGRNVLKILDTAARLDVSIGDQKLRACHSYLPIVPR